MHDRAKLFGGREGTVLKLLRGQPFQAGLETGGLFQRSAVALVVLAAATTCRTIRLGATSFQTCPTLRRASSNRLSSLQACEVAVVLDGIDI